MLKSVNSIAKSSAEHFVGIIFDSIEREALTAIKTPPPLRLYFLVFSQLGSMGCVFSDLSSLNILYLSGGNISLSKIDGFSQVSLRTIMSGICL